MPEDTSQNAIQGVGQIAIAVSDLEEARFFYQEKLGLTLLFDVPPNMAFFDCGGVRLMLTTLQGNPEDHHTSVIYYKVKDIHASTGELKNKGIVFIQEPVLTAKMPDHELWMAFLRDTDNNLIGMMAEMPTTT